jgi:hypothetical protein
MSAGAGNSPTSKVGRIVLVAPVVVLALSWSTSSVRGDVGVANVALLLAAITVWAALSNAVLGVITAIVAAVSLNVFHTEPVNSLRIATTADAISVTLLAVIGLSVSAATALRVRRTVAARSAAVSSGARTDLRSMLGELRPVAELWAAACTAAGDGLDLVGARLVDMPPADLAVVARTAQRSPVEPDVVVVPEAGAVVQFRDPRSTGCLLVVPLQHMGAVAIDRRAVFAFVDQVEAALGHAAAV